LLGARRVAMATVDHAQLPKLNKTQDLRFGLLPLPRGKVAANLGLSTGLCLAKGARRQDEALKLLVYLAGIDGQKQLMGSSSYAPALEVMANSEYFAGGDKTYPYLKALSVARPLPVTPRYAEVAAVWAEELAPLWAGQATAQQVAAKVDRRVDAILKESQPTAAWLAPVER
jgi:ABC-type glycerol-3-phosphate transport system substrate-binding protein